MRQLNTYHNGMAGYLMDFGFGGFIGYAKDYKNPPRLIYDWLNWIRELGFEQKFRKD